MGWGDVVVGFFEELGWGGVIEWFFLNVLDLVGKFECVEELNIEMWEYFILVGYVYMLVV